MNKSPQNKSPHSDLDVVILVPCGRDAARIDKLLHQSGVHTRMVAAAGELIDAVPQNAGAAIVAEEAMLEETITRLAMKLESQPKWSDFPIIVLTGGGMSTRTTDIAMRERAPLGNMSLLERPVRAATVLSAVRSALTARRRQYEIRDHLQQREMAEQALRHARDTLESLVQDRTAALRRLSAQLLRVQDEERRRIARELHDGLGQYLAAAKITLDTLMITHGTDANYLNDVEQLIDRSITETRTLSHLLHPPLLDATGFSSAASWYVDGFGKRSGMETSLSMPAKLGRMPTSVETALFRIMQEALTNVHRHSGSHKVEITLEVDKPRTLVTLAIRDFGKGIPKGTLEEFKRSGTNVGVGLAGIRERLKELGGSLDIQSNKRGTTLKAAVPIAERLESVFATPSSSHIYSSFVT
jgi:signal transduction histidine kinase